MQWQRGIATVEFAIVSGLLMVLLFGVVEFGRAMFVANALAEGARRGARLAAVCQVGDTNPAQAAIFSSGGSSLIAPDLSTSNVTVSYLNSAGAAVANPAANLGSINYVRVSISYTQALLIPFMSTSFAMPSFTTTLPAESLGYAPTAEAFQAC